MAVRKTNRDFYIIDPQPTIQIKSSLLTYFNDFGYRERKAFNYLVRFYSRKGKVYVSQWRWAMECGISIRQLQRYIDKWHADGLVFSNYRHMMTNQYKVSSFFARSDVRRMLQAIIFSFGIFPTGMLINSFQSRVNENVVQPQINLFINRIESNQESNSMDMIQVRVRTREKKRCETIQKQSESSNMIKPYVQSITYPVLTERDKVVLSRYSENAIRHALVQMQRYANLENPIGFMVKCAQTFDERATKGGKAFQKVDDIPQQRNPIHEPYKQKEVRDAAFWKKDNEKMAHWSLVELAVQYANFKRDTDFDYLIDAHKGKMREALGSHIPSTCHICMAHGNEYTVTPAFYVKRLDTNNDAGTSATPSSPALIAPPPTPAPQPAPGIQYTIMQDDTTIPVDEDPWGMVPYDPEDVDIV